MSNEPTIPQILVGLGLFTAGSLGFCAFIWLGKTIALRRGWIVKRQEPIRQWAEFDAALRNLGQTVARELGVLRLRDWLAAHLPR
jgi:hypothetical protein